MTCPTCNGPMAALFTSTYCPACEAKASAPKADRAPVAKFITATNSTLRVSVNGVPASEVPASFWHRADADREPVTITTSWVRLRWTGREWLNVTEPTMEFKP